MKKVNLITIILATLLCINVHSQVVRFIDTTKQAPEAYVPVSQDNPLPVKIYASISNPDYMVFVGMSPEYPFTRAGIQAAIDHIKTKATYRNQGYVLLPSGYVELDEPLKLYRWVHLVGTNNSSSANGFLPTRGVGTTLHLTADNTTDLKDNFAIIIVDTTAYYSGWGSANSDSLSTITISNVAIAVDTTNAKGIREFGGFYFMTYKNYPYTNWHNVNALELTKVQVTAGTGDDAGGTIFYVSADSSLRNNLKWSLRDCHFMGACWEAWQNTFFLKANQRCASNSEFYIFMDDCYSFAGNFLTSTYVNLYFSNNNPIFFPVNMTNYINVGKWEVAGGDWGYFNTWKLKPREWAIFNLTNPKVCGDLKLYIDSCGGAKNTVKFWMSNWFSRNATSSGLWINDDITLEVMNSEIVFSGSTANTGALTLSGTGINSNILLLNTRLVSSSSSNCGIYSSSTTTGTFQMYNCVVGDTTTNVQLTKSGNNVYTPYP